MILDTNAVTALFAGDPDIAPHLQNAAFTAVPVIVIGEYKAGLKGSTKAAQLSPLFERLLAASRLLPITAETTDYFAEIYHDLKSRGRPIPQNDLWIAALAAEHGITILSRDTHFDHVRGIVRQGW